MILDNWNSYLKKLPDNKYDIYFTSDYCKLYKNSNNKVLAYIYESKSNIFIFPFILEEIPGYDNYYDFHTAYGYGGPLSNTSDIFFINKAVSNMKEELNQLNCIAGFVRFHPVLQNHIISESQFPVYYDRNTVSIDLRPSIDDIWQKQIHSKNRNSIRKAGKNDLKFVIDKEFKYLDVFIRIYKQTMKKLSADEFYDFNEKYYIDFKENLRDNSYISLVFKDDIPISAALIMYHNVYGHYHLAGSDHKWIMYNSNNFLLWENACYLKSIGVENFHLGGGTNSDENNSLLAFKKKFSFNINKFHIGKFIINSDVYNTIKSEWEINNPDKVSIFGKYTLCYRY